MVKAGKWFRGLLGLGKSEHPASPDPKPPKRRWSFVKSNKDTHRAPPQPQQKSPVAVDRLAENGDSDPAKHAVAVAAATAKVAEAAIAAAQAAAAVVQLTSSGRSSAGVNSGKRSGCTTNSTACVNRNGATYGVREVLAAVKIQSHFRAYLSRRALRALKALVRLQAVVKGYLVRKHTAEYLRGLQALVRAQSRARSSLKTSESPQSSSKSVQFHHPGPPTPEKYEQSFRTRNVQNEDQTALKRNHSRRRVTGEKDRMRSNRLDYRMDPWTFEHHRGSSRSGPIDDWKTDKILEMDTAGNPKPRNLFHSSHLSLVSDQYSLYSTTSKDSTAHQIVHSPSYCEAQSVSPHKFDESCFCTADNSPQYYSASSKGGGGNGLRVGPFTPSKSDSTRSVLSGYSDHPNYMSYTKSAKAKMRSFSAPKQRPHQYERSSSTKRYSIHGYGGGGELRTNSQRAQAYPGSGRLDSLGMPVVRDRVGFSDGGVWHRY
ncbi:unnamed protein product [Cuscuta epithymum]|uniref:DUF4005 domain-containing protein n=1 Tax=Cuscuta epithymum TaxID=186058 RepID=A0AAV0G9A5_9ASTE|nr:unnamed protein product [Cuscuta epithymum]